MKGDFTRLTFDRRQHYSSVRMQQGRVQLDADWNEQADLQAYRTETECIDTVGMAGMPMDHDGFRPVAAAAALTAAEAGRPGNASPPALAAAGDFLITAGRGYVGGWLAENERIVRYADQPDLPGAPLPASAGIYIAWLDVWQRHITALEAPALREVALGGPDTTTRLRTVWQLRLLRVADSGAAMDCSSTPAAWIAAIAPPTGRLAARAEPGTSADSPCVVPADAGYRRLENQLYRVEVHRSGNRGTATFKWSRDNGAVASAWVAQAGPDITVASEGRDRMLAFAPGQWVELIDDARELRAEPGTLVRLAAVDGLRLTLDLPTANGEPTTLAAFGSRPRVRRWDGNGMLLPTNDQWLDLEDGVQVRLTAGSYRTGDHWLIPARVATADIDWPRPGGVPQERPPQGIEHRHARLAVMHFDGAAWTRIDDCRRLFPPLTRLTSFYYLSGDGQEAAPADPAQAAAFVPLLQPLKVGVANGSTPMAGAPVRFSVLSGGGRLNGAAASLTVLTDAAGVATLPWELGWAAAAPVQSQQVAATLLDAGGQPMHLPVTFSASLSRARAVAYEPGGCDHLSGAKNVQEALDALCALASFFYLSGDGQEVMPSPGGLALLPQPLRVGVARGPTPVAGARVRFSVIAGGGQLDSTGPTVTVPTGADGVASCRWALSGMAGPQVVEARLLDAASQPVQLPVRFNAGLSVAAEVAYEPSQCSPLQALGATTVQQALDLLCRLRCEEVIGPGELPDRLERFAADEAETDLALCLLPGEHRFRKPLGLKGKRSLRLHGAGPSRSRWVLDDVVLLLAADELVLKDVGVQVLGAGQLQLAGGQASASGCEVGRTGGQAPQPLPLLLAGTDEAPLARLACSGSTLQAWWLQRSPAIELLADPALLGDAALGRQLQGWLAAAAKPDGPDDAPRELERLLDRLQALKVEERRQAASGLQQVLKAAEADADRPPPRSPAERRRRQPAETPSTAAPSAAAPSTAAPADAPSALAGLRSSARVAVLPTPRLGRGGPPLEELLQQQDTPPRAALAEALQAGLLPVLLRIRADIALAIHSTQTDVTLGDNQILGDVVILGGLALPGRGATPERTGVDPDTQFQKQSLAPGGTGGRLQCRGNAIERLWCLVPDYGADPRAQRQAFSHAVIEGNWFGSHGDGLGHSVSAAATQFSNNFFRMRPRGRRALAQVFCEWFTFAGNTAERASEATPVLVSSDPAFVAATPIAVRNFP